MIDWHKILFIRYLCHKGLLEVLLLFEGEQSDYFWASIAALDEFNPLLGRRNIHGLQSPVAGVVVREVQIVLKQKKKRISIKIF